MGKQLSPLAGKPAAGTPLIDVDRLLAAFHDVTPDPGIAVQRVAFGTSGHRGSSLEGSFNEAHVLAITQAICDHRKAAGIDGPLFIGADTHALSKPATDTALQVLAANGVRTLLAEGDEPTPTPAVSHAILVHNRGRERGSGRGLADGIVVTPSHNPPASGGFKYNPPNGGPAGTDVTGPVEKAANAMLQQQLSGVRRMPLAQALAAPTTGRHDYIGRYVADLGAVIDLGAIRGAGVRMGVDPLGGAGVHYWGRIAETYRLDLTVVSEQVDPTFSFMTLDHDGQIRMDPSSRYAMQRLIDIADRYDIAFACDTDHDRHGIVVPGTGLLTPNQYLAVAIDYLFRNRPQWPAHAGIGKTLVSTQLIDRVAQRLTRPLQEMPVGFKWFAPGLVEATLGFGGEESAGATFLRRDGTVWTTDKDGLIPSLLSAEIIARTGRNPGIAYDELTRDLGRPYNDRVDAAAKPEQKKRLAALQPSDLKATTLAGEPIQQKLSKAPANGEAIGGIKVVAASGWFAARPSGTEDIYKIYAESFKSADHLQQLLGEAQQVVDDAIGG